MELGEAEKIALADALYESLHAGFGEAVEDAWGKEIAERLRQIDSGEAELIDGETVMNELREIADGRKP